MSGGRKFQKKGTWMVTCLSTTRRELEELKRRIKEIENRRIADVGIITYYELEDDIGEEWNVDERNPTKCLISFFKDRGNAGVEVSCYDGNLKAETLVDWIG